MAHPPHHEVGGPGGGTRGGYIDSFENMPGAQNQPFGVRGTPAFVPRVGFSVQVAGGRRSTWLDGAAVRGVVCDLVPGQLHQATAVVRLERPLTAVGRTGRRVHGDLLVLEPAGTPSRWHRTGHAHVELWPELPSEEPWLDRAGGIWVDDAAPYTFD